MPSVPHFSDRTNKLANHRFGVKAYFPILGIKSVKYLYSKISMIRGNGQAGTHKTGCEKEFNPDGEITQEMIEAGIDAYGGYCEGYDSLPELLESVFVSLMRTGLKHGECKTPDSRSFERNFL